MRLLEPVQTIARIVARIDYAKRTEARAEIRVRLDDIQRHRPEVRATRGRIVCVHTVDKTIDRKLTTEQHHTEKQRDQQRARHTEPPQHKFKAMPVLSPSLARLSPDRRHDHEKEDLSYQTDD